MRIRFTVAISTAICIALWFWYYPERPADAQQAALSHVIDLPRDQDWMGGFSGIDLNASGTEFHMVTDRGQIVKGILAREAGKLTSVEFKVDQPLVDKNGRVPEFPHTDAEGIAVDVQGRVFVSFEHAHRVLFYDTWESHARWPSYTRSWRALENNKGLEALAISDDGTLFAIPEQINKGASETLVYLRSPHSKWAQPFTLPIDENYKPVGADFGPDGRFYILERGLYPFGFYSRVRVMFVSEEGFQDIQTVMHTALGTHGNLEGLSVWRHADGSIRLTMVSDDNFLPFSRSQIVEYVVKDGVASVAN